MSFPNHSDIVSIVRFEKDGVDNSWIIMLKDAANLATHLNWVKSLPENSRVSGVKCEITIEYDMLNGYSAELSEAAVLEIARSPDVDTITQNRIGQQYMESVNGGHIKTDTSDNNPTVVATSATQFDASWALARICRKGRLQGGDAEVDNFAYYDSPGERKHQVDVYVIDTGIYVQHADFGGRASWGKLLPGATAVDHDGHGTMVAGLIAGKRWGSGKSARVIAMKNANEKGKILENFTIAHFNDIIRKAQASQHSIIINYSGGFRNSPSVDRAAVNALKAGVHVCAAVANDGILAEHDSPARVPGVIAVGATTIDDRPTSKSNFGPYLTLYAPGALVNTTWKDHSQSTIRETGTSLAAPLVSGVMANILAVTGTMSPAALRDLLTEKSETGVLKGVPSGTHNRMLQNGFD
ncbi:subtilisin-like serine protease [Ceratobasidium sp. 428]|nr:subtilisin-like serine protease [Ceratobasidium sp. 428]